jgi:hypothetical protein
VLNVGDKLTLTLIPSLHEARNEAWDAAGLSGSSTEQWSNIFAWGGTALLYTAGGLAYYKWATTPPPVLYHFTTAQGAQGILATNGIRATIGLFTQTPGVYLTRFESPWLARLYGAAGTSARFTVPTAGLPLGPVWWLPGAFKTLGASVLL